MKKFNTRAYISLTLTAMLAIMCLSGLVILLSPKCRDASWSGWSVLLLGKETWETVHITSGICFALLGLFHLWWNLRPMLNYIRTKSAGFKPRLPELSVALLTTTLIMAIAILNLQPISSLTEYTDSRKLTFAANIQPAPWMHAETSSLSTFCNKLKVDDRTLLDALKQNGYNARITDTLQDIADQHGTTPMNIYYTLRDTLIKQGALVEAPQGRKNKKQQTPAADQPIS